MIEYEGKPDYISIDALFGAETTPGEITPNPRVNYEKLIGGADLIFGVNIMENRDFLVFGREVLERILKTNEPRSDLRILRVGIDQETDDLERLIALVDVFKGHNDYRPYEPPSG